VKPDANFAKAAECEDAIGGAALLCTISKAAKAARGCFSRGGREDGAECVTVEAVLSTSNFEETLGEKAL